METNETFRWTLADAKERHQTLLMRLNDGQEGGGVT